MALILHADDEGDIRERLATRMKRDGHDVVSAKNGQVAWTLLCNKMPKLPEFIISDYDMPKMTGSQLLRSVRSDSRFLHIPFTLFSASDRDIDGTPLTVLCAELKATLVDKRRWEPSNMTCLLQPLVGL